MDRPKRCPLMPKQLCQVVENKIVAPGHWVLKLRSALIAKEALPGQFIQILCADGSHDPLLPRPFSFLDAQAGHFTILYHVVGKGTELLSKIKKRDTLRVLGPLGNGFSMNTDPAETRLLVGGGVGIPPLYHLARTWVDKKVTAKKDIHVFLGARNKSLLLCEKDFAKLGVTLHLATDDGSKGQKGFVTEPFQKFLSSRVKSRVYTCGPTPMLKAVSALALKYKVACEVSVEVPMACGFGACLGCAVKVHDEKGQDRFAIACTEGPVFQGSELVWE